MIIIEYFKRPKLLLRDISTFLKESTLWELALLPFLYGVCFYSRFRTRTIDVGLGPEPLINNVYHKRALKMYGYTAQTFAWRDNFISSDYDINLTSRKWPMLWKSLYLFVHSILHYKAIFIYFNGGPLFKTKFLRFVEPHLLKLANVKTVVMPFGSDVQVMSRNPNLYFRHTMAMDYPNQNREYKRISSNVDRWIKHADWIISGCEWVYYTYHWNTLQLAHFSIDLEQWKPATIQVEQEPNRPFRIFHAPNHKTLKGTQALMTAIEQLQREGLNVELVTRKGVPNHVIREVIESVDLVADQFVIGWYALFAIEAMSLKKPVLCYLREDLLDLYLKAGLVEPGEIPLINTNILNIAETIRWAYHNRETLHQIGERGREYVQKHHSIERVGKDFADILEKLEILPSQHPPQLTKTGPVDIPEQKALAAAST